MNPPDKATPRTEAARIESPGCLAIVPAEFARGLERELTATNARIAELEEAGRISIEKVLTRDTLIDGLEQTLREANARIVELEELGRHDYRVATRLWNALIDIESLETDNCYADNPRDAIEVIKGMAGKALRGKWEATK